jgi:hypothetical protein
VLFNVPQNSLSSVLLRVPEHSRADKSYSSDEDEPVSSRGFFVLSLLLNDTKNTVIPGTPETTTTSSTLVTPTKAPDSVYNYPIYISIALTFRFLQDATRFGDSDLNVARKRKREVAESPSNSKEVEAGPTKRTRSQIEGAGPTKLTRPLTMLAGTKRVRPRPRHRHVFPSSPSQSE